MTNYRLMDGASGRPGVGSSGTQPPSSPAAFTGTILLGLPFMASQGGTWFGGYWFYVPATNGSTTAQKFCLWQTMGNSAAYTVVVPGSTVTSGTLTTGWNFVALATPLNLTPNFWYVAATGMSTTSPSGFPDTQNQFGAGNPYASGITNGPLTTLGATGWPFWTPGGSMLFALGSSDPTTAMPNQVSSHNDLEWLDVQISDTAPTSTTPLSGFPSMPGGFVPTGTTQGQTGTYTLGLEFHVTAPAQFSRVRFFSPADATALPSWAGLWNADTQTLVTSNSSPSWKVESTGAAASAGAGWIYCDFSGSNISLNPGTNYKSSVFATQTSALWFSANANVFGTGQVLASGFTNGILVVPGSASASPGQDSWNTTASPTYPNTTNGTGEYDGIDVTVTPIATITGSGGITLPPLRLSGAGSPRITGSGGVRLPPMQLSGLNSGRVVTSRSIVRDGVAAYFGGSWVENIRGYQGGPLASAGVGTVRAGWSKRLNMQDIVKSLPAGRGMGAYIVVEFGREKEYRRAIGGPPQQDASGAIIAGGIVFIQYRVTLHCFHMAQAAFSEDAQADVDLLIEAIKFQVRRDRTLGMQGVITDAGQTRFGIQTTEGHPGVDKNDRTGTYVTVEFEIRTQIIS